jgi:hypothetical protein
MTAINLMAAVARMGMAVRALGMILVVAATALYALPAAAFHEDDEAAKAAAVYREAVLRNGAANAANAHWEAQRLDDLKPRLTESQRRELDRCVANGMIYVSPSVGCRSYREDW